MKSKLVRTVAVFMALATIPFMPCIPVQAGESEASSEAGLEAPTIPRGRRGRRGYYRQQANLQRPQSNYVTSGQGPMNQMQGRGNGNNGGHVPHAQVTNYGAGGRPRRHRRNMNATGTQQTGYPNGGGSNSPAGNAGNTAPSP